MLEEHVRTIAGNIANELIKQANPGYFKRLTMRIFDNVQIKIRGVHIRFEDHFSSNASYTFGLVMESLDLETTNSKWVPEYIDRT